MDELFADINGSAALNEHMDRPRLCLRCASTYTERENIGRWQCTAYHPLERYATTHDALFLCCERPRTAPGCVPADHTDVIMFDKGTKSVSRAKAALLDLATMVQPQSWRPNGNGGFTVERFEPQRYAANVNTFDEPVDPDLLRCPPALCAAASAVQ